MYIYIYIYIYMYIYIYRERERARLPCGCLERGPAGSEAPSSRGNRLHARYQHVRNRGFSMACSNGLSMASSNGISLVSSIFQRIVTFLVDIRSCSQQPAQGSGRSPKSRRRISRLSSWVFIKGGCSGRGVQWMGVVLYNNTAYHII